MIRPGVEWGEEFPGPPPTRAAATDAELAVLVDEHPDEPVSLRGGWLWRSLGAPRRTEGLRALPIDVLDVVADGTRSVAVAHVVARRSWWRGGIVAVLNADQHRLGRIAPRAHPNDGRFDIVTVDAAMGVRQRWMAARRARSGSHLPHPAITVRTAEAAHWTFDRPTTVWVDDHPIGSVVDLGITLRGDAGTVVV